MMRFCKYLVGFLCLISLVPGQAMAGIILDWGLDPEYQAVGAVDDNTGFLIRHRADGTSNFGGTVTMLDNWNPSFNQHQLRAEFTSYSVRLGINRPDPSRPFNLFDNFSQYSITDIRTHPSYGGLTFGHDFALGHIPEGVSGLITIPINESGRNVGDLYRFIGGGAVGIPGGTTTVDGFIRGGYNRLTSEVWPFQADGETNSYLRFRFDAPGSIDFTDLEFFAAPGDSGGRTERWNPLNLRWELDGLMAGAGPSQFGGLFEATPLPRSWIAENRYSPTSIPEPSSFALFGGGSLLFLLFRRNRKTSKPAAGITV